MKYVTIYGKKIDYEKIVNDNLNGGIPKDIHISFCREMLKCLVSKYGWKNKSKDTIEKNVKGGTKGDLNPKGNRIITVTIDNHYNILRADYGWDAIRFSKTLGSIFGKYIKQTPECYAKLFNDDIMNWADLTKD